MQPSGSSPRDEVVLAVDIGTSGARAFMYDAGYAVRAVAATPIATTSGAGWLSLGRAAPRQLSPARATQERSPDPAAHAALSAKSALMRDLRRLLFPSP